MYLRQQLHKLTTNFRTEPFAVASYCYKPPAAAIVALPDISITDTDLVRSDPLSQILAEGGFFVLLKRDVSTLSLFSHSIVRTF